jgi:nitrate/nitrite transporter NarK
VWNPRTYLLAAAYAACFGVELTVANIVSLYLFNHFSLSLTAAGFLGEWLRTDSMPLGPTVRFCSTYVWYWI